MTQTETVKGTISSYTLKEIDRLLRRLQRISYSVVCCGIAFLGALFLLIGSFLPFVDPWSAQFCREIALLCLLPGILFLTYCLYNLSTCAKFLFGRRKNRVPLALTPHAQEYYRISTAAYRHPFLHLLLPTLLFIAVGIAAFSVWNKSEYRIPMLIGEAVLAFLLVVLDVSYLVRLHAVHRIAVQTAGEDVTEPYSRKRERNRAILFTVLYWLLFLAVYLYGSIVMMDWLLYIPLVFLGLVLYVLRLVASNPFRSFSSVRGRRFTARLRKLSALVAFALLIVYLLQMGSWYNNAYIQEHDYPHSTREIDISYEESTGTYTLTSKHEEFRVLQLTDVHICGSITSVQADRKAIDAVVEVVRQADPDLIIVTGDMVFPVPLQSYSLNNLVPFVQLCQVMDHIGVPWTFVFGNHDNEPGSRYNIAHLLEATVPFRRNASDTENAHWLLYAEKQPDCSGRYQQVIRVCGADGKLQELLFCMDSNDYIDGNPSYYDCIHADQIEWYRETVTRTSEQEGHTVPSYVFFHIPIPAFAQAEQALSDGSPDAVYLFGENEETPSCSELDEGMFDTMLELGSTRAVFVGHDHLNRMAVRYKGIDLVYSRSIDYIAYPGIAKRSEQRGGTLLRLFADGTYAIESVDYDK